MCPRRRRAQRDAITRCNQRSMWKASKASTCMHVPTTAPGSERAFDRRNHERNQERNQERNHECNHERNRALNRRSEHPSRDAITRCNQRSAHPKREDVRGQPVRLFRFDLGREIEGGADAGCGERRAFDDLEGGAKVAELAPADRGRWRSGEIGGDRDGDRDGDRVRSGGDRGRSGEIGLVAAASTSNQLAINGAH